MLTHYLRFLKVIRVANCSFSFLTSKYFFIVLKYFYRAEGEELVENDTISEQAVESFTDVKSAKACFICDKIVITRKRRKFYCREIKNKQSCLKTLKKYGTELNDASMLQKIEKECKNLKSSKLTYHTHCNFDYYTKYQRFKSRPASNEWAAKRDFHKTARAKLTEYIEIEILQKLRVLSMTHLKNVFMQYLQDLYALEDIQRSTFSFTSISSYIEQHFKGKIQRIVLGRKVYLASVDVSIESIADEQIQELIFEQEALEFAAKFRAFILKIRKHALPDEIDSEILAKGECEVPRWLTSFWNIALSGSDNRMNDRVIRLSSSLAQDSIYNVTRGNIKPRKHIMMGIGIKSLTGSEKVINIISKQGHCISYSSVCELETSAAYTIDASRSLCPIGLIPTSLLSSGIAWDNFDRFVESNGKRTAGKDSLHDTVGIMFQSKPTENQLNIIQSSLCTVARPVNNDTVTVRNALGKRKRSFEPSTFEDMTPAKQRRPEFQKSCIEVTNPETSSFFKKMQFGWLLSHILKLSNTPMWVGYHAKIMKNEKNIQKIGYLTQINSSPTDHAVVKETMLRSLKIADECEKIYYNVTYDLAIAKIAFRIQSAEDQFTRLFIHLGPFHVMLSYFKAIGKFISGSGLTNILVETETLANGSVNTFLTGKHFNR